MRTDMNALLDHVLLHAIAVTPSNVSRVWSKEEDNYLREQLGWMTDKEIGNALGRSEIAVHLRWSRDLGLPSPSKHPEVLTALQASEMLGIDGHKIAHWVDMGLIPGRYMAGSRKIRLIQRISFMVWACSPKNWVYFDIKKVRDPKLKRLIRLRAKRWGNEWWPSRKVADYHGVDTGDVKRYIKMGRLKSFRLPFSLGGRHEGRKWSNHFVLKSDALAVKFIRAGQCIKLSYALRFTPRADAWLLKARDELGMTFVQIGKTMKIGKQKAKGTNPVIAYRYKVLKSMKRK